MQYLGGKSRIAKSIAEVMLAKRDPEQHMTYLEPFVGGGAVFTRMAPHFDRSIAADTHEDLILMWQAVKEGRVPPDTLTEVEYQELRHAEPSARRAFAGFGCSFSGKWFGGYARPSSYGQDYIGGSSRVVRRQAPPFRDAEILRADYREFSPGSDTLVYCDPPYANTTGYSTGDFDSAEFWQTMQEWHNNGALVFVSEYQAPPPWSPIWEKEVKVMIAIAGAGSARKYDSNIESLWSL